jgi:hypothetical protein
VNFLRSAAREVIGLFVSDWVQTVAILAILAAGWFAMLHVNSLGVLIALVLLLAAQHVWFALAEARRASRPRSPSPAPN